MAGMAVKAGNNDIKYDEMREMQRIVTICMTMMIDTARALEYNVRTRQMAEKNAVSALFLCNEEIMQNMCLGNGNAHDALLAR